MAPYIPLYLKGTWFRAKCAITLLVSLNDSRNTAFTCFILCPCFRVEHKYVEEYSCVVFDHPWLKEKDMKKSVNSKDAGTGPTVSTTAPCLVSRPDLYRHVSCPQRVRIFIDKG